MQRKVSKVLASVTVGTAVKVGSLFLACAIVFYTVSRIVMSHSHALHSHSLRLSDSSLFINRGDGGHDTGALAHDHDWSGEWTGSNNGFGTTNLDAVASEGGGGSAHGQGHSRFNSKKHHSAAYYISDLRRSGVRRYFWATNDSFVVRTGKFGEERKTLLLSGSLHYFRVHPAHWSDRLRKLKACGLNTVSTYVPWNFHEPGKGRFLWAGWHDLPAFLNLAKELGLFVVLRPGPYIGAEWEWGGLPYWLLNDGAGGASGSRLTSPIGAAFSGLVSSAAAHGPAVTVRSTDPLFMRHVEDWFAHLLPLLAPFQYHNGGPVVAMQVENEYGNHGFDHAYVEFVLSLFGDHGIQCLLFTTDSAHVESQLAGGLPGLLRAVNMHGNPIHAFNQLRVVQPKGPLMAAEYWAGWFDSWGQPGHFVRTAKSVLQTTKSLLDMGVSFNFYMFHGGTNFAFYNGALRLDNDKYRPHTTSYDYDALLTEAGDMSLKWEKIRQMIGRRFPAAVNDDLEVRNSTKTAYPPVAMQHRARLFDNLDLLTSSPGTGSREREPVVHSAPLPFESPLIDLDYGFLLYRTRVEHARTNEQIRCARIRDRAQVFADEKPIGVLMRDWKTSPVQLTVAQATGPRAVSGPAAAIATVGTTVDILVENLGRINYGAGDLLDQRKGLLAPIRIGQHHVSGDVAHFPLPLRPVHVGRLQAEGRWQVFDAAAARKAVHADDDVEFVLIRNDLGERRVQRGEPRFGQALKQSRQADPSVSRSTVLLPDGPVFFRATFSIGEPPTDTFLRLDGWSKGVVFLNGFTLGRYWTAVGPQRTLYVPGPLLRQGVNELIIFEQEGVTTFSVSFSDRPDLGQQNVSKEFGGPQSSGEKEKPDNQY